MTDLWLPRHLRRRVARRDFLRGALAASAGGIAFYALGCGSSDDADRTPSASEEGLKPQLLTQEFVAGQQSRVAVGLLTEENELVTDAKVHARFFTIQEDGVTGTFRGEGDMEFVELNVEGAHAHDSSGEDVVDEDSVSYYQVTTEFDVAGRWGIELTVTPNGETTLPPAQVPVLVLETSQSPAIGTVPPASQNDTVATNSDTFSLCTRDPICGLHDKVIADVLGKGRPLVVQFSTPSFCETRFCGPVLEVLLPKAAEYEDRVDFVHIEVWQDHGLGQYRPAVREWNLPGEPYTFFMDEEGKVVGRLEAIFTEEELAGYLEQLVTLA